MLSETTKADLFESMIDRLRSLATIVGSISGVCYVVGFVIVNIYLGQFGVQNLELIKSKYFASGLLFLAISVVVATVPLLTIVQFRQGAGVGIENRGKSILILGTANLVLLVVVVWASSIFLTGAEPATRSVYPVQVRQLFIWIFLPVSQAALWFPIALGWIGAVFLNKRQVEKEQAGKAMKPLANRNLLVRSTLMSLFAFCTLISLFIYAVWVFPHIAPTLGGGAPMRVQFFMTEAGVAVADGLQIEVSGKMTESLVVLDQTENRILILANDGRIIEISTRLVDGVVH